MSSDVCMPPTSTEGPDVQTDRKTPKQICLCVVEKLNMIFLVFFICYLSWSIPANYGLFTSKSSNVSMSYSSAKVQIDDINSTEEIVDGWVLLNSSDFSSTFLNNEEDFSFHKVSYRKERKHNKWKNRKNKKKKKKDKGSTTVTQKQKNKNKKRRKNKKCKKCKERKKMRTKFRENMLKLEPTAIRQIIERVAEEALQKGAGSMDFGVNYNPFTLSKDALSQWSSWSQCSVTCNSGRMSRSRTCGLSCRETESMVCYMPSCKRENKKKKEEHFSLDFDRFIPPLPTEEYINEDVDTCEEWIGCNNQTIKVYLNTSNLPSCPCYYPLHLSYNNKVWDRYKQKHFRWQDILFEEESVNAFKPKAHYCIRSKLYKGTKTLAAQSCCYDDTMRLITRGKSAGTPNLISPEISPELHQKLDINPWVICKGDWTRYNEVIAPNNELNCRPNPNEKELDIQIHQAQNY